MFFRPLLEEVILSHISNQLNLIMKSSFLVLLFTSANNGSRVTIAISFSYDQRPPFIEVSPSERHRFWWNFPLVLPYLLLLGLCRERLRRTLRLMTKHEVKGLGKSDLETVFDNGLTDSREYIRWWKTFRLRTLKIWGNCLWKTRWLADLILTNQNLGPKRFDLLCEN